MGENDDRNGESILNNHYEICIDYHERQDGKNRVVGVVAVPYSRDTKVNDDETRICVMRTTLCSVLKKMDPDALCILTVWLGKWVHTASLEPYR